MKRVPALALTIGRRRLKILPIAVLALIPSLVVADVIHPSTYSLLNGELGGDVPNFFDDTYSGIGDNSTPLAPLSGGLGDLTDGVIANLSWRNQPERYVGWQSIDPTISFQFATPVTLDKVTFYFDDAEFGGVDNPAEVTFTNGIDSIVGTVADPVGSQPFSYELDVHGMTGSVFDITLHRQAFGSSHRWVMLSEVSFEAVPEPSAGLMLASLATLGLFRRRPRTDCSQP